MPQGRAGRIVTYDNAFDGKEVTLCETSPITGEAGTFVPLYAP